MPAGKWPRDFIRRAWGDRVSTRDKAPLHPKSALQEWAAAHDRKPPDYRLAGRSGPQHAPTFVVEVEIRGIGSAQAEGASKQEAETAAAAKLLGTIAMTRPFSLVPSGLGAVSV